MDTELEPAPKRRKLRKGTFSCWECKRRKKRCEVQLESSACDFCRRNELSCISQDFDDDHEDGDGESEKRIEVLEALTERLVHKRNSLQRASRAGQTQTCQTPVTLPSPSRLPPGCESKQYRSRTLSGFLYSVLPGPEIASLITTRGKSPFTALQIHGVHGVLELTTHPVLLACKLIHLALCLRQLVVNNEEDRDLRLARPAIETAQSYMDAALQATCQDFLMKSVQGLETLKLQAVYQIILGGVNSAWQTFRRGVGLGHVAGLSKSKDKQSESTWFRTVYSERFASLSMGLQCTKVDDGYASDDILAKSACTERINRIHVMIAGRIIRRNERLLRLKQPAVASNDGNEAHETYTETKDIDHQLKQGARAVDPSWWMIPNMINMTEGAREATDKLTAQVHQQYLLLLTHQPCLMVSLRSWSTSTTEAIPTLDATCDHSYTKITSASASRQLLFLFLLFRNFKHIPTSYSGLAHKAFLASFILLLIHLDSHRLGRENALEHQRLSDLSIMPAVLDCLGEILPMGHRQEDASCVRTLSKLLELEAEAAFGEKFSIWNEGNDGSSVDTDADLDKTILRGSVPYFGRICISRSDQNLDLLSFSTNEQANDQIYGNSG